MCISLTDKGLCNVEVLSGVEYGTIRRQMLRFMPPVSSLEKWLGNRIFTNISYRGVCPQTNRSDLEHYIRQDKKFENLYKRRSDNMCYRQQDDCLSLNLYIPTTGKINSFCLLILIYIVKRLNV
jgi:carboxylesterase type B